MFYNADELSLAKFNAETEYNQWTVFPSDFDPVAAGLTQIIQPKGDFDDNGVLDHTDLDLLVQEWLCGGCGRYGYWPSKYDLDDDARGDQEDLRIWVEDAYGTFFGDADLNGEVAFEDFLALSNNFGESGTWSQGDFDANGQVNFGDFLILANNFGKTRSMVASVPEPSSPTMVLLLSGFLIAAGRAKRFAMRVRDQA